MLAKTIHARHNVFYCYMYLMANRDDWKKIFFDYARRFGKLWILNTDKGSIQFLRKYTFDPF